CLVGHSVASSFHVRFALNKNEETLAFGKNSILPAPESLDQAQWREGREEGAGDNDLCSNFPAVTDALHAVAGTCALLGIFLRITRTPRGLPAWGPHIID